MFSQSSSSHAAPTPLVMSATRVRSGELLEGAAGGAQLAKQLDVRPPLHVHLGWLVEQPLVDLPPEPLEESRVDSMLCAAEHVEHDGLGCGVDDGARDRRKVRSQDRAQQRRVHAIDQLLDGRLELGEEGGIVCEDVGLLHGDELLELGEGGGALAVEERLDLLTQPCLQPREAHQHRRFLRQQPRAQRTELLVHGRDAIEARRQQLSDGTLLGVCDHVLEELNGRDGKGEMIALAIARRLEQVCVWVCLRIEGLHGLQLGGERRECILDAAAGLDVGALLYEGADEVAAERGDEILHQRRARRPVRRHCRSEVREVALGRRVEGVDLSENGREVLLEMSEEDAGEEAGERGHAEALGEGRVRPPVCRMPLEVARLRAEALAHREALFRWPSHLDCKVAERQLEVRGEGVGEILAHVGSRIHQVYLGKYAHRPRSLRVELARQLHGGVGLEVGARGADHQDDCARLPDVARDHLADLVLDVLGLSLRGERGHCQPGQVHQRQVGHVGREEPQEDSLVTHALQRARAGCRLRVNGVADGLELSGGGIGAAERDGLICAPAAVDERPKLGAHLRRLGDMHELQRERCARHHLLAERQNVGAHDAVEERRLAAGLRANDDQSRHLGLMQPLARRPRELSRGEDAI
mmetsp:Transcript_43924/g.115416  ORF Transcript_43924/g.115416 Transcript_43924/m.115416 type:complete len:642 (-) Transcript_43924:364-2289(-)